MSPMPQPTDAIAPACLTTSQAKDLLLRDGPNALPQARKRTWVHIALEIAREPMFQLLVAAAGVYFVVGDRGEALTLLVFVVMIMAITLIQEQRTERVLEALRELTNPRATVLRDGASTVISGSDVVVGDLLVLSEGERVAADAQVLEAHDLLTDESLLTGEAVPVRKVAALDAAPASARPGGDNLPFVYAATVVVGGQGLARVIATGERSEIGRIGAALHDVQTPPTPLHLETRRLVRVFSIIGLGLSVIVAVLYGSLRNDWLGGVLAGITLAMSMLPQEFVLILTVFMTMGAWRMARQKVLTRRSATIETLGSATVLCTDKTGTLTQNRMTVAELRVMQGTGMAQWSASSPTLDAAFHALLDTGVLASEVDAIDPMEMAIHTLGAAHLPTQGQHAGWELIHEYSLSRELLAMSHVWEVPGKQESHLVAVKGAPEAVVDLCHLEAAQQTIVLDSAHAMAQRGLRVLGVARATYPTHAWPSSQHDFAFEFLGLIALSDPLRPEAITAIRDCRAAGIRVAMITGDFASTAQSIAAQAGLDTQGAVLTGVEVAALDDAQLQDKVANTTVFARVLPEQKLRIVNAFKARGEVVAMTGDGVNDAPSLKAAHIGIAMGKRGTHVAREASALVLLDDDFSAIVRAIRLGRRIYDNLRKAMAFVLAVHVPIAGLSLLPLLVGLPIVFMPVHIAFLELVIDPVASFVFEAEEEETDVMQRPPRDPKAPLFSSSLMGWSVLQGVAILICTGILYAVLLSQGHAPDQARAATFTALVMANFGLIVVNRSFAPLDAQVLLRPNKALLRIFAATIALLAAALGIPLARELFHFGELTLSLLAVALGVSLGTTALLEMLKRLGLSELLPTAWRLGR